MSEREGGRRHPEESRNERLDRNWAEVLQELRVAQTGVQILTGFLLTIPFSPRFTDLSDGQQAIYLVVLLGSILSTALLVAPAAYHRLLFRRGERAWLVTAANRLAIAGLTTLGATIIGVVGLVFDVVVGRGAAIVVTVLVALFFLVLWGVVPLVAGRRDR